MKIKILLNAIFILVLFFLLSNTANAAPVLSSELFQITSTGVQENAPLIWGNWVVYRRHESSVNIYGYNLASGLEVPLLTDVEQQFPTGLFGNKLVYEKFVGGDDWYDVRMLDILTGRDQLIAGGTGSQGGGVIWGDYVVYIDGGACGEIHAYNLETHEDMRIDIGCGPLSISQNVVVWAAGAPGGTNVYGWDLKKKEKIEVSVDNGFQEQPDIYGNSVVYLEYGLDDSQRIYLKNLITGDKQLIRESDTSSLGSPSVSNRFVIWRESPETNTMGIYAMNLRTKETANVFEVGPQQNTNTATDLWNNIAVWQSWRTGNGDIYGAILK